MLVNISACPWVPLFLRMTLHILGNTPQSSGQETGGLVGVTT